MSRIITTTHPKSSSLIITMYLSFLDDSTFYSLENTNKRNLSNIYLLISVRFFLLYIYITFSLFLAVWSNEQDYSTSNQASPSPFLRNTHRRGPPLRWIQAVPSPCCRINSGCQASTKYGFMEKPDHYQRLKDNNGYTMLPRETGTTEWWRYNTHLIEI